MELSPSQYDFLRPLVTVWLEKVNQAKSAPKAKEFRETAEQCMAFFAGSCGFMWDDKYRKKFMGGRIAPKFRLSLNKAFEIVALFGPILYHRNPVRRVQPHKRIDWEPSMVAEAVGIPGEQWVAMQEAMEQATQLYQAGQPVPLEIQQQFATYQQAQQAISHLLRLEETEKTSLRAACQLMERYLSFTPREQPNGGLEQAAEDAITEALIKGRGLLWPRPYTMPASQTKLTGSFYGNSEKLYVDPDAETINFGDCKWICLEHLEPHWEVERRFGLEYGSLRGKGKLESKEAQALRHSGELSNLERQRGKSFDLVRWWEIWSTAGVGTRLSGVSQVMNQAFDDVVGDYAYLAVCEGVPFPLNAPTWLVREAADDEVREMFDWPIPSYLDQRWPCVILDFYREPGSPYPVAPLKPGLGELTFLNIVISSLTNRIWRNSRTILAVLESARVYVDKALKSGEDTVTIGIKEIHGDINKMISEFQQKDISYDVWRIVDRVFELFDKRVGLSDLLYGLQGAGVSRSATDVKVREEKLTVRPDYMSKKVDQWMTEAARLEKLVAYWSGVEGRDVRPLLGSLGARLWDTVIAQADPETVLREMDATVEAGTARKPNRERDAANINQIYQPMSQQLVAYAQLTGDSEPLNELNRKLGESIEQDMAGLSMGPWASGGPDPAEMEIEAKRAEMEAKQAEIEAGLQAKAAEVEMELRATVAEMRQQEAEHGQQMRQDEAKHKQDMKFREEEQKQKVKAMQAQARMKRLQAEEASKNRQKTAQKTKQKTA